MARQSALINVMVAAALKVARGLARDFGEVENLQVSQKGPAEFVGIAQLKAQRTLKAELSKARPDFGFLMPASDPGPSGSERRWIADPLNGAGNFLHGIPHYCVAIAVEQAGELIAGVIYQPLSQELFWAEAGIGAFINDRRLRVSGRRGLAEAVVATGIPHAGERGEADFLARMQRLLPQVAGVRQMGAPALDLAYVAAGRFDAYWESGLSGWDVAAGVILLQEAGGFTSDLRGGHAMLSTGQVLAANPHLRPQLLALLREPEALAAVVKSERQT